MTRLGVILRLVMLALCLVPFTSPRQASAAFAPTPAGPVAPEAPGQEEDGGREEEVDAGKGRVAESRAARRTLLVRSVTRLLPAQLPGHFSVCIARSPAPLDPFRNGLGSPYRC